MKKYKMSENNAWSAENRNFDADVIVTVDDSNVYQSSKVLLTVKHVEGEFNPDINLRINDEGRYEASLRLTGAPVTEFSSGYKAVERGMDLANCGAFMELLEEEANAQLDTVDGLFAQKKIKLN